MQKLTKQTIKPVLKFIGGWSSDIHSLNTSGATIYSFTLDTYNGKNSFSGGWSWDLRDCYSYSGKPYEKYAINLETGEVYDLETKQVVMKTKEQ